MYASLPLTVQAALRAPAKNPPIEIESSEQDIGICRELGARFSALTPRAVTAVEFGIGSVALSDANKRMFRA